MAKQYPSDQNKFTFYLPTRHQRMLKRLTDQLAKDREFSIRYGAENIVPSTVIQYLLEQEALRRSISLDEEEDGGRTDDPTESADAHH